MFSLADLRGGIGFGVDEASWVTAAYNIAEVAVVPLTPWLAAIISPRRAMRAGHRLLTLAGGVRAVGRPSFPVLVALRFLQGMGGGALIPLLLAQRAALHAAAPARLRLRGVWLSHRRTPLFAEGWRAC